MAIKIHDSEITNHNKNNKKKFQWNERRCSVVKTQKSCEQGWEAHIGHIIKQTTFI